MYLEQVINARTHEYSPEASALGLEGKIAIVTGGGSGIGRATAILFSRVGARVTVVGRHYSSLAETTRLTKAYGGEGGLVEADVSKSDEVKSMVSNVVASHGRLDILVNNAGVEGPKVTVVQMSEGEWDQVMDINLKGAFLCSKYAIPEMIKRGGGVVTNVASNWGIVAGPLSPAYCASKGGLILLSKAMAIDHARDNIRVNCICPGNVDTPMIRRSSSRFPDPEQRLARLGKLITSEEIAHAILYLVSDEARMTTGSALVIDNGTTSGEGAPLFS